jgi:putative intracellular protease/amidase
MPDIRSIGVLGYDACSEQDTLTPLEIFRGAAMVLDQRLNILRLPGPPVKLDVKLVSVTKGNVKMQMGTEVVPDVVLDDSQSYDLFFVPGGVGAGAMTRNEAVLQAIRRHYQGGKIIGSNCSGVGVLFKAGILGQTPVTCVAAIARRLRELGANVPQPRMMWQGHPDARIWTATGSYGVHGGDRRPLFGPRHRHHHRDDVRHAERPRRSDVQDGRTGVLLPPGTGDDLPVVLGRHAAAQMIAPMKRGSTGTWKLCA